MPMQKPTIWIKKGYDQFYKKPFEYINPWEFVPQQNEIAHQQFLNGFNAAKEKYIEPYKKELSEKLKDIGFSYSVGCGCCGAGAFLEINGVVFDIGDV